jgi:hypothetical protein
MRSTSIPRPPTSIVTRPILRSPFTPTLSPSAPPRSSLSRHPQMSCIRHPDAVQHPTLFDPWVCCERHSRRDACPGSGTVGEIPWHTKFLTPAPCAVAARIPAPWTQSPKAIRSTPSTQMHALIAALALANALSRLSLLPAKADAQSRQKTRTAQAARVFSYSPRPISGLSLSPPSASYAPPVKTG